MAKKRYFWLKLMKDFFQQPTIKKLRRIAGGDTYTVIYLKMQLLSLENGGKLYFEGVEDSFVDEIALTIDEDPDNVQFTVMYLQRHGMIEEITDSEFIMPEAVACIGSETAAADRMRRMRQARKRDAALPNPEPVEALPAAPDASQSNTDASHCYTNVRGRYVEIDKERETDKEREKKHAGETPATPPPPSKRFKPPTLEEVRAYCTERGNNVDPQRFIDYYTANGWKVGRNAMKDWRASVRTWEQRDKQAPPRQRAQDERSRIKNAEEHAKGGHTSGIGW